MSPDNVDLEMKTFMDEGRLLNRLQHPNLVKMYGECL